MVNAFETITVADAAFPLEAQFTISDDRDLPQRGPYFGVALMLKSGTLVEYSFDGTTVHGDLEVGTPSSALTFDRRPVPLRKIWFRGAGSPVVRVEAWGQP